jgi:two-component system, OmpR family, phosphate regulon sensor histidine kinase PhoR
MLEQDHFGNSFIIMARVLIIDDDRHMRSACSRVLSKAGWSVICAETGDEGLKEIKNSAEKIDVILLDQLMPGISGMDALAQIRTINPNLPVIIITGSVTDETSADIIRKGACRCLPKPFTPEELRVVVNKAVSGVLSGSQ